MPLRWLERSTPLRRLAHLVIFGVWYLMDRYGSYDVPFIPMAALVFIGAWRWIKIDPSQALIPRSEAVTVAGMPVDVRLGHL